MISGAAPLRIMVVDDEPAIVRFLRTGLSSHGYVILSAGTGRAGMGPVRNGGCSGAAPPAAKGGLKGAGLLRSGSSTVETVASWAGAV